MNNIFLLKKANRSLFKNERLGVYFSKTSFKDTKGFVGNDAKFTKIKRVQ